MAKFSLTNATIYGDGYDLSCASNNVNFTLSVQELVATTFCNDGFTERVGGLKESTTEIAGYWEGDGIDDATFDTLGTRKTAFSVAADDAAGSVAYLFKPIDLNYSALGQVGELAPFSLTTKNHGSAGIARGQLIAPKQDVSATGALTGFQVGAVGASAKMYVATHVFSAGTTVTFDIESDDNSSFTSATSRATIGALTGTGGTWTAIDGAITDDYWRVNVTACTGTFSMAVAIGIA